MSVYINAWLILEFTLTGCTFFVGESGGEMYEWTQGTGIQVSSKLRLLGLSEWLNRVMPRSETVKDHAFNFCAISDKWEPLSALIF